jgi:hypothetical protein
MNYTNNSQINVYSQFIKNYPFIVKDEFGILYQLQHFRAYKIIKKLLVSKFRVRIDSKWVKLSTLNSEITINSIKTFETKLTKQDLMKSLDF